MTQSSPVIDKKSSLREEAKRTRSLFTLSAAEQDAFCDIFHENIAVKDKVVAGYYPKGRELDCIPLLDSCAEAGANLCLPIIEQGTRVLGFAPYDDNTELERAMFGVWQPITHKKTAFVIPDIVIVPLLAFDQRGYRLGYGGGYYDSTLAALREQHDVLAVGVAYAQQACLFNLPNEEHDIKMDWIITPQSAKKYT